MGRRRNQRFLNYILSLIPIHERGRFLKFALKLQVFGEVTDHVDLLLDVCEILLFLQHPTVVVGHVDVQAEASEVPVLIEVLA